MSCAGELVNCPPESCPHLKDREAPQVSSAGPLLCRGRRLWCLSPGAQTQAVCHGPRVDRRGFTLTAVMHRTLTASAPGKRWPRLSRTSCCGWGVWTGAPGLGRSGHDPSKLRQPRSTEHLHPKLLSVQTTVPQGFLPWDSGCKPAGVWKPPRGSCDETVVIHRGGAGCPSGLVLGKLLCPRGARASSIWTHGPGSLS